MNVICPSMIAIANETMSYEIVNVKVDSNFYKQKLFLELPSSLVLGYALMITTFSKLENVYLAGFDGYITSNQKNSEVNLLIHQFLKAFSKKN